MTIRSLQYEVVQIRSKLQEERNKLKEEKEAQTVSWFSMCAGARERKGARKMSHIEPNTEGSLYIYSLEEAFWEG